MRGKIPICFIFFSSKSLNNVFILILFCFSSENTSPFSPRLKSGSNTVSNPYFNQYRFSFLTANQTVPKTDR